MEDSNNAIIQERNYLSDKAISETHFSGLYSPFEKLLLNMILTHIMKELSELPF